jgi:integrase
LEILLGEADEWFGRLIKFAVFSGLRPNELARLEWSHVDMEKETITILKQKNGSQSIIPLSTPARGVLKEMDGPGEGFIFNSEGREVRRFVEYVSKRFRDLRDACGLRKEITMYSTRHATATLLIEQGVSPVMVQKLMRHADLSTTMRYVHVATDKIRSAVNDAFSGI